MKKSLIILAVLGICFLSADLATQAYDNNTKGTISVNTSAETEVAPDLAEISFAIKTFDTKSMQQATLANRAISEKVYTQLKSMINTDKGDSIKTSDFSAQPIYSYVNSKKIFDKYEVSNRITIRTKSINQLGEIIDKAIDTGATNVENLSFSLSNYEKQCDDLLVIATQKAKKRANIIAQTLNTSIQGISNISTSCNTNNYNNPRLYMAKNMISDIATESSSLGSTIITEGTIKINANINASFFVK